MLLFAQTIADNVVKEATRSGWEAGALAIVMLAGGGLLVWLVKVWMSQAYDRELRLSERITALEDEQRTEIKTQRSEMKELFLSCQKSVDANTAALSRLMDVLAVRPCLLTLEQQLAAKTVR